jgi:hypothetical protein
MAPLHPFETVKRTAGTRFTTGPYRRKAPQSGLSAFSGSLEIGTSWKRQRDNGSARIDRLCGFEPPHRRYRSDNKREATQHLQCQVSPRTAHPNPTAINGLTKV